jgi:hypothetical protein
MAGARIKMRTGNHPAQETLGLLGGDGVSSVIQSDDVFIDCLQAMYSFSAG